VAHLGKIFEGEIKRFLESKYKLAIRLPDILIQTDDKKVTTKKPFDFCACDSAGRFVAVECKATRSSTFSFNRVEDHQAEALGLIANTEWGKSYLALNFRGEKQPGYAHLIPWQKWLRFKSGWHKKSVRREELRETFWEFELIRIAGGWKENEFVAHLV